MIIILNVFLDIAACVQDPVVQSPIKLILVVMSVNFNWYLFTTKGGFPRKCGQIRL